MTNPIRYPDVRVLVSPGLPRENKLPALAVGRGLGAIDITALVTRVRTTKTLAQPNGTCEIGCTYEALGKAVPALATRTESLSTLLVPQNLIEIAFNAGTGSTDWETVFQGPIARVVPHESVGDTGEPQREIVVAGEDYGQYLVRHEIPAHLFTAFLQGDNELFARSKAGAMLRGSVGDVCKRLFNSIFVDRVSQLQLKTQQVFTIDIDKSLFQPDAGYTFNDSVWTRQGKFWNELRGLADEPWNELYADYLPHWSAQGPQDGLAFVPADPQNAPRFVIRLRKRPFDEQRWNALETHIVRDEELFYQESALADDERYNWVIVDMAGMQGRTEHDPNMLLYQTRRFDQVDAEAHGARLLRRQTAFFDFPGGPTGDSILQDAEEHERFAQRTGQLYAGVNRRAGELWDWYSINHRLRRASWVIPLRPEIRIGTRVQNQRDPSSYFVKEEDERRTYYVEQIVHDFQIRTRRARTHLGLTRGQALDTFLRPYTDGQAVTRQAAA